VKYQTHSQLKGPIMTRSIALLAGAAVFVAILSGSAFSQGAPQTLSLMKVDPQILATGYRTSKVVGSTVVNEANEDVGTIDDLIVTPGEKVPFAVLSIGGFLDTPFLLSHSSPEPAATSSRCISATRPANAIARSRISDLITAVAASETRSANSPVSAVNSIRRASRVCRHSSR
jgi:PRC-barrel domain